MQDNNHGNQALVSQLAQSPLLANLSPEIIEGFLPFLRLDRWDKRTMVMPGAQTAERFYLILSGRVRVEIQHPDNGRAVTLFLLAQGDCHNIVTLLDNSPHNIHAESLDAVEAVSAPIDRWQAWIEAHPELRRAVYHRTAAYMRKLADLAEDLALHDTSTRLAHLLLRHIDKGEASLIHDLAHEDLAHLIGSVRVVVNRVINQFKREGIVHTEAGSMHVTDLERLLQKTERLERDEVRSHKKDSG